MNTYKRHRVPPDIISYAVWLYFRFNLSHRDIEDLLTEKDITVSHEAIRLWCIKFGAIFTRRLKRKLRGYGDTFYIDEVFVKINGKQHYLWRAVDQAGAEISGYACRCLQPIQSGRALSIRRAIPKTQDRCVCRMESGSCLSAHDQIRRPIKANLAIPF